MSRNPGSNSSRGLCRRNYTTNNIEKTKDDNVALLNCNNEIQRTIKTSNAYGILDDLLPEYVSINIKNQNDNTVYKDLKKHMETRFKANLNSTKFVTFDFRPKLNEQQKHYKQFRSSKQLMYADNKH